jgi:hypothetical protein
MKYQGNGLWQTLATSSAGAIIYSTLQTKFAVTGHYEVHPGVLRKNISTQQSTWMEMVLKDGNGAAVALEDGSSVAALGAGVGRWLKIAAMALGGGDGRKTCNDGICIRVRVVKAKDLLLQHWHQRWQGRQERMRPMQGTYVGSNSKGICLLWRQQWR